VGIVTIGTTAIPAGWYKDPAGSSALRWWDGTRWTDSLQQPTPPPAPVFTPPTAQSVVPQAYGQQPAVAQEPQVSLSSYSPMIGYSNAPRDPYANDQYSSRMPAASVSHNNTIAWISFVAGLVSLGTILIVHLFPGNYLFPFFGLTAIVSGIRAAVRYRSRRVTNLWAPILGIIFGVIAEIILLSGFFPSPALNATVTPTTQTVIGPTGSTTNYDMGVGSPQYLPTANATLVQAAQAANNVVNLLQADYANPAGKTGAAADGLWPADLTHTESGDVTTSDGRNLGNMIPAGWHLAYRVGADGSYQLGVSGPNTAEVVVYNSATGEYLAWCEASDATCKTASPVTPITTGGTATSNPAVPTTS
jgi:hypothetical protein